MSKQTDEDKPIDVRPLTLDAADKRELFAAVAAASGGDADELVAAFEARESEGSTAVVTGLALPHAESAGIERGILFDVRLANAVAWAANDDPVERCFCVVFPAEDRAECAALMAEAARRAAGNE